MTEKEMLTKIQELADQRAQNFPFKKTAKLDLVYNETLEDGSVDCYCLGADMPSLIYRIFNVKDDGTVKEYTDLKDASAKTAHYNAEVKPQLGLEKTPVIASESPEYEIVVENRLEDLNAVEIKLRSSVSRDITMIEIYRYFDYVSKVYFVCCVSVSFGGQYLFSVTPDSKHLKLIITNDEFLRQRINMMSELLQARLLPSYQTIAAGVSLLSGKNADGNEIKAHIALNNQNGQKDEFDCAFCYDDAETSSRFAFFGKTGDPKQGIILIQDTFTNRLIMSNNWTDAQKAAVDRIKKEMTENKEEFNKHVANFFTDSLDFRYAAFKNGTLKANTEAPKAPEAAKEEAPAAQPETAPAAEAPAEAPAAAEEPKEKAE